MDRFTLTKEERESFDSLPEGERQELLKMWARDKAKPLADELAKWVNINDTDVCKAFVEQVVYHEHRYLQNEIFFMLVVPLIKEWARAYKEEMFDARNELTCKFCAKLTEHLF